LNSDAGTSGSVKQQESRNDKSIHMIVPTITARQINKSAVSNGKMSLVVIHIHVHNVLCSCNDKVFKNILN